MGSAWPLRDELNDLLDRHERTPEADVTNAFLTILAAHVVSRQISPERIARQFLLLAQAAQESGT